MVIEVYAPSKPAVPLRAVAAGAGLLALATALAGYMTWERGNVLAPRRLGGSEFGATFRAPRDFVPADSARATTPLTYRFHEERGDPGATLLVQRFEIIGKISAQDVCLEILKDRNPHLAWIGGRLFEPSLERIGDREAVEIIDGATGTVVRATTLPDGRAYALTLVEARDGTRVRRNRYRLFELVCRSFEYLPS